VQVAKTIADRIAATGGRATGFDYMRIVLAVSIIAYHTIATCYGKAAEREITSGVFRAPVAMLLPMFFALSGFLVAGSLERSRTLVMFLGLRAVRIFPALAVEIALSALILGPIFTSWALGEYFTDPLFASYFWNIVGDIHYFLPGVFEDNPYPGPVNPQLRTVPRELECYIAISLLAVVGVVRRRWMLLAAIAGLTGLRWAKDYMRGDGFIVGVGTVDGFILVLAFLAGVAVYLYRENLPWSFPLFRAAAALSVALFYLPMGDWFVPLPVAYVTAYLGLQSPAKLGVLKGADYSYGLFLYGYPIQQAVATVPALREWYWNLLIALPAAALFAALSWTFVEKPALGWRKQVKVMEEAWLRLYERAGMDRVIPQGLRRSSSAAGRVIQAPSYRK
jgi:peptidoglycan/LPS O-acetylase OafA/YrhL